MLDMTAAAARLAPDIAPQIPQAKKVAEAPSRGVEPEVDLSPAPVGRTDDPVRMYLREMGAVSLLTREGEVEIAKRIDRVRKSCDAEIIR